MGTMQSGGGGYVWHIHEKMMMKKEKEKERENKTPRLLILLRKPNKSVQQRPFASLVKSAGGIQKPGSSSHKSIGTLEGYSACVETVNIYIAVSFMVSNAW